MRSGLLLFVIAVSAAAIGYQEIRWQAERATWQANLGELSGRLERTERLAEKRGEALVELESHRKDENKAASRLAELEGKILDAAAELARLESDRTVAKDRAETAIGDLKKQVRALTTIEIDMATLDKQRGHLERQVETIEQRLQQAEIGAAERQKRAEELDRNIAGLAIRREALLANLKAVERERVEDALTQVVVESVKDADVSSAPATTVEQATSSPEADIAPLVSNNGDKDHPRGLYQFSSLSAEPEAAPSEIEGGGQGGLPPLSARGGDRSDKVAESANWAEDQYLLGLRLISNAEQSSSTRELNEAILAFKAVLVEWPKERDPMRWAIAQSDLGYAMALLGKRQGDASLLAKAANVSRAALGEFERSKAPLLWAAAQHHLGVSLGGLADIRNDQDIRLESIEALTLAVDTFKDAGADADAEKVEFRLRKAYADLPKTSAE